MKRARVSYPPEYAQGQRAAVANLPKAACPFENFGSDLTNYCWWMAGFQDKRKQVLNEAHIQDDKAHRKAGADR